MVNALICEWGGSRFESQPSHTNFSITISFFIVSSRLLDESVGGLARATPLARARIASRRLKRWLGAPPGHDVVCAM